MPLPFVSIIPTCKGRLHHLRETLPSMLAQDYAGDWEIVVVDYDCPDGTFEWVKSLDHPRVQVGRTELEALIVSCILALVPAGLPAQTKKDNDTTSLTFWTISVRASGASTAASRPCACARAGRSG